MSSFNTPSRVAAATIVAAIGAGSVAAATAPTPSARAARAGRTPIDRLAGVARRRWATEVGGSVARATLHRVARDATLRRLVGSGDSGALRTYVRKRYRSAWYHWHVSRLRIAHGSRVVVDVGVPFVVAPSQMPLRGRGGRRLGTLQVSVQDVVGFVRFMHRNYPVDVVARGVGAGHMRSSLPAAGRAHLPARGRVTLGGRRYDVRSFHATALGGEPVTVSILAKG